MEPVPSWPLTHAVAVWPELQTVETDNLIDFSKEDFYWTRKQNIKKNFC